MTFKITAPSATSVEFASDCFGWDQRVSMQRTQTDWQFEAKMPADSRTEYQYVIDGKWQIDPENPKRVSNGMGGFNSVYEGPNYHYDVNDAKPIQPMRRMVVRIAEDRDVIVYAPRDKKLNDLRILIYADGQEYESRLAIQNVVQNLVEDSKIEPVVLALVPPRDRMIEYWRRSAPYEEFIATQLLPELREVFPISSEPEAVFVGGASLGGLISLRLAQNYPAQIRGGVHSQSGAFWAAPGSLSKAALSKLDPSVRLYFDWGSYEGVLTESNERLCDMLHRMGRVMGTYITHEGHNWTAWKRRFSKGLCDLLNN